MHENYHEQFENLINIFLAQSKAVNKKWIWLIHAIKKSTILEPKRSMHRDHTHTTLKQLEDDHMSKSLFD